MKRETLYRGKRKDNGEWVYGNLFYWIKRGKRIPVVGEGVQNGSVIGFEVDPETTGEYIGVYGYEGKYEKRHRNEVRLFEGDVVEAMSQGVKGTFVITFRGSSEPKWILYPAYQSRIMWSIHASDAGREKGNYYDDLCRIGNIHDNPELNKP